MNLVRILGALIGLLPLVLHAKCERTGINTLGQRTFACDDPLEMSDPKVREALLQILRKEGIMPGQKCGFVGLGGGGEPVVNCARAEALAGNPYWIAFQGESWDSEVWRVGARRADASGVYFSFDSNAGGLPELDPTYFVNTCKKIVMNFEQVSKFWCAE